MPEGLEAELTRRAAAPLIGRRFDVVERTDPLVVGEGVDAAVPGLTVAGLDRRGKLVLVWTTSPDGEGPVIGLHFGMTGRLVLGGASPIDRLAYGTTTDDSIWDRWVVRLDDGSRLRFHDPRRFGRITLEPDADRLGPDALSLRRTQLDVALRGRRAPLKAVLLDQGAIAGFGNMLVDEILWRAGLAPARPAGSLTADEVARLHAMIRRRLPVMLRRGGSHTGTLSPVVRAALGPCPRCGTELARSTVGGRTTIWCPGHQVGDVP